jgi:diguanylate cyclase (GGDEF)-like protein
MSDEVLLDIIQLCISIDRKAAEVYSEISSHAEDDELRAFWKSMAAEEARHVLFWKRLKGYAERDAVPQIFDEPFRIRQELESIEEKVDVLIKREDAYSDTGRAFLLAYRLEYYVLHPAFETLFQYMRLISDDAEAEDEYGDHLRKFMDALNRHGATTPELEILGEAIHRLWTENKKLVTESNTDSLTGALNRRGFFSDIKPLAHLSQRNNNHVGVLMMDIDDFKKVNDTHGHQAGDAVLKSIAGIIKSSVRASDVVGRYGGEEFIVYLSRVDDEDALAGIAEMIRRHVELETANGVPVTISVGAAHGLMGEDVEKEVERFIKVADGNLYKAKASGKNMVVMSGLKA